LIHQASLSVSPGHVIVLGAGRCQEIPLRELVDRFGWVTLTDRDGSLLHEALTTNGLDAAGRLQVQTIVADLSGIAADYMARVADYLTTARDPAIAAEHLAVLADDAQPEVFTTGRKYDLVIASCVLCQLHLEACNGTLALFVQAFPGRERDLLQSQAWIGALYGLARRMENTFLDSLAALAALGGRIFLSDTVQSAFLRVGPEGDWITDGVYRMTRTTRLSDYVDARFRIDREESWLWIMAPAPGAIGRIYNTQGLILTLTSA
jgi:hypothetical protein